MTVSRGENFQIVSPSDDSPISLEINTSIFLSCFAEGYQGVYVTIRGEQVEKDLVSALDHLKKQVAFSILNAQFKVILSQEVEQRARAVLKSRGLAIRTWITRQESSLKVIFYPGTGRLRMEKESPVAISSKTVSKEKQRVLIVDDSATIRKMLSSICEKSNLFEVMTAELPSQVESLIQKFKPHVITLDIHMPEMDGVTLLKQIAPKYKIPTVMITSVSREEGSLVLEALESGAIDYIQKPNLQSMTESAAMIIEKLNIAALARTKTGPKKMTHRLPSVSGHLHSDTIIAIGSSTGGTEALKEILIRLPANIPPIVITQHIPPVFSAALAQRLDSLCAFKVKEAEDGDFLQSGLVLIAPGATQMSVIRSTNGKLQVKVTDDPPVNRHRPSVDVLFRSVAAIVGKRAVGIILTGMGADGAEGLLQMKNQGSRTIAQDEKSCVVFGMPNEAIKRGATEAVVSLDEIPEVLMNWLTIKRAA